ncbi:hypothetical protein N411_06855 [Helicobacter pylori FD535]|nr:hypothetical protein N411_06855 [Helicobacter pylori FD535]
MVFKPQKLDQTPIFPNLQKKKKTKSLKFKAKISHKFHLLLIIRGFFLLKKNLSKGVKHENQKIPLAFSNSCVIIAPC